MAADNDVVIIGSGIAGALIAWELARRGVKVQLLEKGPGYPYPHAPQFDEVITNFGTLDAYALPPDLKGHTTSGDYREEIENERYMNSGGSAAHWDGITLRMLPQDFKTKSLFGYGQDWPIGYDELEPFYCRAETLLGVSGTDADNPFAPPRSQPYPMPHFALSYDDLILQERLKQHGLALHTTPQARTRHEFDARPGCQNFGACMNCPIGARYSPNHHLQRAIDTGNCTLLNDVSVRRIVAGASGAATLAYRSNRAGGDVEVGCRAVVVAAGALETVRLLMLSRDGAHGDGLGNAGGQLGQHFGFHHIWPTFIRFQEPMNSGGFGGYTGQSHQFLNPETRGRHGGVKIEFTSRAPRLQQESLAPWVSVDDLKHRLRERMRLRPLRMHAETCASPGKSVRLSEAVDRFGDPFVHVHYQSSEFDAATHAFAMGIMDRFAAALEAEVIERPELNGFNSGSHHMGGCRMGQTPDDSVCDALGRVHGLENVYVAGSSLFSACSGAVNPTLTIAALALRSADALAEKIAGR